MKLKQSLRSVVGITLSAATMLAFGLVGVTSANADDSIVTSASDGNLTIKSESGHALGGTGSSIKALRIGAYGHAASTGTGSNETIDGVEIKETGKTAVNDYETGSGTFNLDSALADAVQAVLGSAPAHQLTDAEKANPLGYVSRHWLGYSDTSDADNTDTTSKDMYKNAELRKFATKVQSNAKIKALFSSGADADGIYTKDVADGDTEEAFTGLPEGIYLVQSVADGVDGAGSIPMIVGTTLGPNHLAKFTNGNTYLGSAVIKSETPFISKAFTEKNGNAIVGHAVPAVSKNDIITYKVVAVVPNMVGFAPDSFVYKLEDVPSNMSLNTTPTFTVKQPTDPVPVSITPDTVPDVDTATMATAPSGYAYQTTAVHGFKLNVLKVMQLAQGTQITISYKMKVTGGNSKNSIQVSWSNDVNHPDSFGTKTSEAVNVNDAPHPPAPGETPEPPAPASNHQYTDSFNVSVKNVMRSFTGVTTPEQLKGATFTVEKESTTPGTFAAFNMSLSDSTDSSKDGEWTPDSAGTSNVVKGGTNEAGVLLLLGMPSGTYRISQTGAAEGHHMAAGKPSFTIKLANQRYTAGDTGTEGSPNFVPDTSKDNWVSAQVTASDFWGLVNPGVSGSPVDISPDSAASDLATTKDISVKDVDSVAQLPLTGGAGVILIAALVVLCGSIAAATSVMRRKNMENQVK
ncbi:SpaA isopeptide-forming pilin-related protein [Bifidobacterium sp. ESL0769]|uniref:SpaA isopeptide-forming pilin-related protein n=1 Tax=Bifidobacterium sp. ESL0769 TaxID=2983229 RepID=UPI0023F62229|nr:SpaA isopeptide-forming pilin-related protein [Bifidobacterium sp. ESL0769]WEV67410.1 SpaA isopeptide-forming pilin-related protein [Bifidobacterium sp. ESL0769]